MKPHRSLSTWQALFCASHASMQLMPVKWHRNGSLWDFGLHHVRKQYTSYSHTWEGHVVVSPQVHGQESSRLPFPQVSLFSCIWERTGEPWFPCLHWEICKREKNGVGKARDVSWIPPGISEQSLVFCCVSKRLDLDEEWKRGAGIERGLGLGKPGFGSGCAVMWKVALDKSSDLSGVVSCTVMREGGEYLLAPMALVLYDLLPYKQHKHSLISASPSSLQ